MSVSSSRLLQGLPQVIDRLDTLDKAADDLRPVWDALGDWWAQRQRTVFATSGLGRWDPFAASTIIEHQSPLVDTGVMEAGVTQSRPIWSRKHGAAYGAEKSDRRVMNPAALHTHGTSKMPKRVVVPPLRAAEKRAVRDAIAKHLHKATR